MYHYNYYPHNCTEILGTIFNITAVAPAVACDRAKTEYPRNFISGDTIVQISALLCAKKESSLGTTHLILGGGGAKYCKYYWKFDSWVVKIYQRIRGPNLLAYSLGLWPRWVSFGWLSTHWCTKNGHVECLFKKWMGGLLWFFLKEKQILRGHIKTSPILCMSVWYYQIYF